MKNSYENIISSPPNGFKVFQTPEGYYGIRYSFLGCSGIVFIVFLLMWISFWTLFCVGGTYKALFEAQNIDYSMLLFMLPFWFAEFLILGFISLIKPTTTIVFYSDGLLLSRTLFNYGKRRVIPKNSISCIKPMQEKDDNWGLLLEADKSIQILTGRTYEECQWLAITLSRWAGMEYGAVRNKKNEANAKIDFPPKGFSVSKTFDWDTVIEYRPKGMFALRIFFAVFILIWTIGCIFLIDRTIHGGKEWNNSEFNFIKNLFWFGEVFIIFQCIYIFNKVTRIVLYSDSISVSHTLFGIGFSRKIDKSSIKSVAQIKDGGGGDDSFPSWGLIVEGRRNLRVLSRQEYEKSEWLGQVIADWAGVRYDANDEKIYDQI